MMTLPGAWGTLAADKIPSDSLYLLRFHFQLKKKGKVRVMFNTSANSRVWLDGKYVFGSEGGRLAPSFHRCPINQFRDLELETGSHELLAGIAPLADEKKLEWVIGIGDAKTKQWLPPELCQWEK